MGKKSKVDQDWRVQLVAFVIVAFIVWRLAFHIWQLWKRQEDKAGKRD